MVSLWATNCLASLKITQAINEIGTKDVRLIALNLDEAVETGLKEAKQWTSMEHFHVGKSHADLSFGGSMIPRVILIDT